MKRRRSRMDRGHFPRQGIADVVAASPCSAKGMGLSTGKLVALALFMLVLGGGIGFAVAHRTAVPGARVSSTADAPLARRSQPEDEHSLAINDLLAMDDAALNRLDPLDVDLAVARTIPGCESLDVAGYKRTVDQWAAQVRSETERHLYKFNQTPGAYKNSLPYFKSLLLATVIGQDFKVGYDVTAVSFDDPRDLFIHGVIDRRRGTCVSLPVLYMAIGHRLGYPIRAVTVAKHIFCRWDDPKTGERLNIEAASAGGLVDHPDDYYMSWPTKCDPKDAETGGVLKSLTMREFLALKLASSGDYYWHKNQRPEAEVAYAQAHRLFPANRFLYEILTSQILEECDRYPWSESHNLLKKLTLLRPATVRVPATQKGPT